MDSINRNFEYRKRLGLRCTKSAIFDLCVTVSETVMRDRTTVTINN